MAIGFFFFLMILFYFSNSCYAEKIEVQLIWNFTDTTWIEINVSSDDYILSNEDKVVKLSQNIKIGRDMFNTWIMNDETIEVLNMDKIKILNNSGKGSVQIRKPGQDWFEYRGDLILNWNGYCWQISNILEEEDYLKGVVPVEMSNSWPMEALKAQAVAARTYLLRNKKNGSITDSPNIHQAYKGKTVEGKANTAVEMTIGQIMVDNDYLIPIDALYSSHNGGYTEDSKNVWTNYDRHYSSHPDPFSNGIGGMVDNWRFVISAVDLGKAFGLAPIRYLKLNKYKSGRVNKVELVDWLGTEVEVTGGDFVGKFYPYETEISSFSFLGRLFDYKYYVTDIKEEEKGVQDSLLTLDKYPVLGISFGYVPSQNRNGPQNSNENLQFGSFIFDGKGWGHGVGMSQWGANKMALSGYSYQDILYYYYDNIKIISSK
ncbi:MAG: SpoIID/LytB domain-containing protein [Eubacteriales bacterium]